MQVDPLGSVVNPGGHEQVPLLKIKVLSLHRIHELSEELEQEPQEE